MKTHKTDGQSEDRIHNVKIKAGEQTTVLYNDDHCFTRRMISKVIR